MAANIAIIGGGEGAFKAYKVLNKMPNFRVTCILCEKSELPKFDSNLYHVDCESDIYENGTIDCVYIAIPNKYHISFTENALKNKKFVLLEKPIANSVDSAVKLERCGKALRRLFLAFKKRYGNNIKYLKTTLDAIGSPRHIKYIWHENRPCQDWYYDYSISGGGITLDLGSHVFDLIEYLVGQIQIYESTIFYFNNFVNIDYKASIKFRYGESYTGEIDLLWIEESIPKRNTLQLFYPAGFITIDKRHSTQEYMTIQVKGHNYVNTAYPSSEYLNMFNEFHRSITQTNSNLPSFYDGLRNLQLIRDSYLLNGRRGV